MKMQTIRNLAIYSSIALALALALAIVLPALPQDPEPQAEGGKMSMDGVMMERCQQMKERKERMMAEMRAQDAILIAQVAAMNSATDDKKVGLMAAIVTHMAGQRGRRAE